MSFFSRLLLHGEIQEEIGPLAKWSNLLESGSVTIVRAGEGSESKLLICVKQRMLLAWTTNYFPLSSGDVDKLRSGLRRLPP